MGVRRESFRSNHRYYPKKYYRLFINYKLKNVDWPFFAIQPGSPFLDTLRLIGVIVGVRIVVVWIVVVVVLVRRTAPCPKVIVCVRRNFQPDFSKSSAHID
jgi:hypothetical protein